ncbi:hypothetical protein AVEN_46599-1 [Araneus ventricosus]|uniref:Uncharacterized protein n=1 Tax=Araneus ventricosus TaxID=182803 RepID=A0A4Y2P1M7_ARAVE|nr:hypothetical protein AVEN_46599-1 [Araneus ventricosus]
MHLSDGRCNSSTTEAGVLMVTTGQGRTSPVGGTHYHRKRASPNHYYTQKGSETSLTYPAASHSRTLGAPSGTHAFLTTFKLLLYICEL